MDMTIFHALAAFLNVGFLNIGQAGALSADIWTLAAGPNQAVYYGVNYEGVYRSRDDGASWALASDGLKFYYHTYRLATVPDGTLFAATDQAIFRSADEGASWTPVGQGLPGGWQLIWQLAGDSRGNLFVSGVWEPEGSPAGTQVYGVFRSIDRGESWSAAGAGLPKSPWLTGLAVGPNDALFTGACGEGGCGSFRSADGGQTWEKIALDLPVGMTLRSLARDQSGDLAAGFAGDEKGAGIYRSSDGGKYWRKIEGIPDGAYATSLAREPSGRLLAAICKRSPGGQTRGLGVYRSTPDGLIWKPANFDFPSAADLFADHLTVSSAGSVFAILHWAGGEGIFKSTDGGASWRREKRAPAAQ